MSLTRMEDHKMEMKCPVGIKKGIADPNVWRLNATITGWLQRGMVTCHWIDLDNMRAVHGLLEGEIEKALAVKVGGTG